MPVLHAQDASTNAADSAGAVRYSIAAEWFPSERTIVGRARLKWRNTASRMTRVMRFHLYLNAFANRKSTFMREAGADFREIWSEHEFGSLAMIEPRVVDGANEGVPLSMQFIQPDDGNPDDRTVVEVQLPSLVAPGEEVVLAFGFQSKMPKAYRRTGWTPGGGVFAMHWYPIVGVYEERDVVRGPSWNCHQFHANSEFFADFARYDVALTVPGNYVVGATGGKPIATEETDGKRTLRFVQDRVHNFAFVADPAFVRYEETFAGMRAAEDPTGVAQETARRLGVPVESFDLPPTDIVLLLQPEHDTPEQRERHFTATKVGLEFFGLRYGAYPYKAITVVDPAGDVGGGTLGGGMEYPTLITCGTPTFLHDRSLRPEGVTVHEFGHQYWYGLSANNEFEEAWLDEGINTYSEGRAQWLAYDAARMENGRPARPVRTTPFGEFLTFAAERGPWLGDGVTKRLAEIPRFDNLPKSLRDSLSKVHFNGRLLPDSPLLDVLAAQPTASFFREAAFNDVMNDRRRWLDANTMDAMVQPGWKFTSSPSYRVNAYQRPATLLRTLERMVGPDEWWAFMRSFHMQARFKHPTTADFVSLLRRRCGDAAARFFEQARGAGATLDYGVLSVRSGIGAAPRTVVDIARYGSITADLSVRFKFSGREEPVWRKIGADELDAKLQFEFEDQAGAPPFGELLEVWIDPPETQSGEAFSERFEEGVGPAGVYLLDVDLTNNAWRLHGDKRPALYRGLRLLLESQSELSFAGFFG